MGLILVVYIVCRLVRHWWESGRTPSQISGLSEGALRTLIRQIGACLQERDIAEEAQLDAAISTVKHRTYQHHYPRAASSSSWGLRKQQWR